MEANKVNRGPGRPRVEVKQHTPLRSIRVGDADWSAWQAAAESRGETVADLIRRAVSREVAKGQKLA